MDCLFCKIIDGNIPSYTIYENEFVKCFLDINPKSVAHTLIIPKKHYTDIFDIDLETLNHINEGVKKVIEIISSNYELKGIKLEQNNGIIQDVKHYHIHIIPIHKNNEKVAVEEVYNKLKSNC